MVLSDLLNAVFGLGPGNEMELEEVDSTDGTLYFSFENATYEGETFRSGWATVDTQSATVTVALSRTSEDPQEDTDLRVQIPLYLGRPSVHAT